MRAIVYKGPFQVAVEDVEDPKIEHPNDVIVKLTSTAICGSDLHMYEGRTAAEPGIVFGHENLGIVEDVGPGVVSIRPGNRVVMPFTEGDPADQIKDQTGGEGTDKGVDAVGYQAQAHSGEGEEPATVLNSLVETVRPTGMLGVPGLYLPADPGAVSEEAKQGMLLVAVGKFFEKGLRMGMGQANVKRYNRKLRDMIIEGRAAPSFVVSHDLGLAEAPDAYEKFDKRIDGYTKVILKPAA